MQFAYVSPSLVATCKRNRLRDGESCALLPHRDTGVAKSPTQVSYGNGLLAALAPRDFQLLRPQLRAMKFPLRKSFEVPNKPFGHVYFLRTGIASVVADRAGKSIEIGIIGNEGMSGSSVLMGNHRSPHATYIQIEGEGWQLPVTVLRKAMSESVTLHATLLKFVHVFMVQTAYTALANGRATLEQRLARWLLMAQDRMGGDQLTLTHEFLSLMLGVRRAGVTVALQALELRGCISSKRGTITIVDRAELVDLAQGFYGTPEAELKRLMG